MSSTPVCLSGASGSRSAPHHALAALRRVRAIQLRASGMTFAAIAEDLGNASKGTLYRLVAEAMIEHVAEAVADRRAAEGARMDALQFGTWEKAMFPGTARPSRKPGRSSWRALSLPASKRTRLK